MSANLPRKRRGTTLLEVLVVMVIFLVGILAIAQIFPAGFKVLFTVRNNSVATALARDTVERLKSNQDSLPEMILPVIRSGGVYIADPNYNPNNLDAQGNQLSSAGLLSGPAGVQGPWQLHAGPNVVRRIVGEGGRVPAPRLVGANSNFYGGLMVLQFGPIDYIPATGSTPANLVVYGNDLVPQYRDEDPLERLGDGEFYVVSQDTSAITVKLPTGPQARRYRISFSAYAQVGAGYRKRDYIDLLPVDLSATTPDGSGRYPVQPISLAGKVMAETGDTIVSVDTNTLRVQRAYFEVGSGAFSNDPYEYRLVDTALGALLFNPIAASVYFNKPTGREALQARVNYDVYDWRILKEDFRLSSTGNPTQQYKLAVTGLKVMGEQGADGLKVPSIPILEEAPAAGFSDDSSANEARADNFVVVDMDTGGLVMERLSSDNAPPTPAANPLITVNKSNGIVTFHDSDGNAANGITGKLLMPDKSIRDVTLDNRALRVMYRAKNEFAVQVLKAAARYSRTSGTPGVGQYFVGSSTRIYFPMMDVGRKVNVGEINYRVGPQGRQILGQDFIIRIYPGDTAPAIDVREVDPSATGFDFIATGAAVKNVHGASVAVRVLWNPDFFALTGDAAQNIQNLNRWGQSWRRSTNETYLERTEVLR